MSKFKVGDLVTPQIESMLSDKTLRVIETGQVRAYQFVRVEADGCSWLFEEEDLRHITEEM